MSESLISSFLVSDVSESLILLKSNEQCELIPHFAHQKWANEWSSEKIILIFLKILFKDPGRSDIEVVGLSEDSSDESGVGSEVLLEPQGQQVLYSSSFVFVYSRAGHPTILA